MSASAILYRLPRRRHLLGAVIVLIGVIAAFLAPDPRTPNLTWKPFAHLISTHIHNGFLVIGILALLFLAWQKKSKALALRTVAVLGTETGLFCLGKGVTWYGFHTWARPSGTDGGFPSGHTAITVALAWLLSEQFGPRWSPLFYAIAAAVAWSRVGDGAHFAYQVAAGAILGYGVAWTLSGRFIVETSPISAASAESAPEPRALPR